MLRSKSSKSILPVIIMTFMLFMFPPQTHAKSVSSKRLAADIISILSSRQGLNSTIEFIDAHPNIFPPEKLSEVHMLDRNQRMTAWQVWQAFLDHILYFDSTGQIYSSMYQNAETKQEKATPFFYAFASFLAEYRYAFDFIERMEKNPAMHVMLNEPVPELGLEKDTYSFLKYRFLNVHRGTEFARLNILYEYYKDKGTNPFQNIIEQDKSSIWKAGQGTGPVLTMQNAFKIVSDLGFTAWFPVQKEISQLMGDIKVWRPHVSLISQEQIEALKSKLRPGDILLERREWYASNIGIPGFWPHAALYIGTPDEWKQYFEDPEVKEWLKAQGNEDGSLESLIKERYPQSYLLSKMPQKGHSQSVVEAIAEGVSFTTLEHSAAADSLAVLRPNLPLKSKALAILRAFHYSGRPYDFNFDFLTDSELVCSELIFKAYEKSNNTLGLNFPTTDLLGRKIVSPNDIAKLFADEHESPGAQLEYVSFLDGHEWKQNAVESDMKTFLASWQRPKWHIWVQELNKSQKK